MEKQREKHPDYKKYKFIEVSCSFDLDFPGLNLFKNIIYKFQNQCRFIEELSQIVLDWEDSQGDLEYPIEIPLKTELAVPFLENSSCSCISTYTTDDEHYNRYEDFIAVNLRSPVLIIRKKYPNLNDLKIWLGAQLRENQKENTPFSFFLGSSDYTGVTSVGMDIFLRNDHRNFILKAVEEYFSNQE